jgi:lysyl-tRNA synthetase class 2
MRLIDELAEFDLWTTEYDDLKQRLEDRGVDVSRDKTWSQLVDKAVTAYIEPRLIEPTILYDYPIELSPFARVTDADPRIVERFEYYVGGMELGNAFSELNDADEQAARFAMQAEEGAGGNIEAEQGDPDYVEALSYGMPPTGGIGLGIDRLTMVLAGKDSIRDVVLFPAQRERQSQS